MNQTLAAVTRRFRGKRLAEFLSRFSPGTETTVLDVGGMPETWTEVHPLPRVTLLNMPRAGLVPDPRFRWVAADGCRLPFPDRSFDIVFSNSVIEHVGEPVRQAEFAREIRRVGRGYWVQTPNFWFPVEPHLLTPVVHWLPAGMQKSLVERWTVWESIEKPSADRREFYLRHYLNDIRLLTRGQMRTLFPDAEILTERAAMLPKSLIAFRPSAR